MRVKIGNHITFYGPHRIAEILLFWLPKVEGEFGPEDHPWIDNFGNWLSYKDKDGTHTWFRDLCEWIHTKRKRKIVVKLDRWDSWNTDDTFAIIAVPLLKQLKRTKNSYGYIDDEDVPEHLQSKYAAVPPNDGDYDSLASKRYEWVLDEIIWAWEQLHPDTDWEELYWIKKSEVKGNPRRLYIGDYDNVGAKKHQTRIDNGMRLFGKYVQTLWD